MRPPHRPVIEIVPATAAHARQLCAEARAEDRAECWATAHLSVSAGVQLSLDHALFARTAFYDGRLIAVYGVGSRDLLSGVGVPWLIGTPAIDDYRVSFCRGSRAFIIEIAPIFHRLENYVDARYARAIAWLGWLGFTIEPAAPWGADGLPFHRFWQEF